MNFKVEFEREDDLRWISELPGVMPYGATQAEAEAAVEALALRMIADRFFPHHIAKNWICGFCVGISRPRGDLS